MKKNDKILAIVTGALCLVGCFVFYQFCYPYHLFYREQMILFLHTPGYLLTYFDKPAWLSCLAGDYLTQYYYLIGGGAAILSFTILLLGWLLWLSFRKITTSGISLILSSFIVIYEIFQSLNLNNSLSTQLSLVGGTLIFLLHEPFIRKHNRNVWIAIVLLPLTYWLLGYGAWIYLLLLTLYSLLNTRQYAIPFIGVYRTV